jgi:hypothetical protein
MMTRVKRAGGSFYPLPEFFLKLLIYTCLAEPFEIYIVEVKQGICGCLRVCENRTL